MYLYILNVFVDLEKVYVFGACECVYVVNAGYILNHWTVVTSSKLNNLCPSSSATLLCNVISAVVSFIAIIDPPYPDSRNKGQI